MHKIRSVGKALFRKDVNRAVTRLAIARKLNKTESNIDGHGAFSIDVRGQMREAKAKQILQEEMQKRKRGIKGFSRLLADQDLLGRLTRMKKFQARKAKKNAKFD
jgi:hypothetical protein